MIAEAWENIQTLTLQKSWKKLCGSKSDDKTCNDVQTEEQPLLLLARF